MSLFTDDFPGQIEDGVWVFPTVESTNSNDKKCFWTIKVSAKSGGKPVDITPYLSDSSLSTAFGVIEVASGQVGGKTRATVPTIIKSGKNIGKKNATNPVTQALNDAKGMYTKKTKKSVGGDLFPPMLAQSLKDQTSPPDITPESPAFMQRKYNGVRCVFAADASSTLGDATGKIIGYSRRREIYPGLDHLSTELSDAIRAIPGLHIDGELYTHGWSLQEISGAARGGRANGTKGFVGYVIYDCFIPAKPELKFSERFELIKNITATHAVVTETETVTSYGEVYAKYDKYIAEKFEGAMLRTDTPYVYSYNDRHCKNLLKMKPAFDHEYKLVGWTAEGRGKSEGCLMVTFETPTGAQFNCTPALEIEARQQLAIRMAEIEDNGQSHFDNHYKNREFIVYYDELSDANVPQRARTKLEKRVD